jgi:serine protease
VVSDFYVAEDGYDIVLFFAASDVDGDLSGGTLEASINGVPESFSVPSDLDGFNPGGLSWVTIDTFDDCTRGGTTTVSGRVSDASGNMSSNNTANFTTSGYGVTVSETGDTTASTTNLGTIPDSPFFICGDIYATAVNYMADVDYINFRPPAAGVFNFSLTWSAPSGDYDLYLLNSAGSVVLASSFEIGNVQPELFNYTLSSASQYQLAVGGWSGGTGPWVIEVQ